MSDTLDRLTAAPANLLASIVSPAGKRARLSVLIYHRVLPEPDPLTDDQCDRQFFDTQINFLSTYFNVLPLPEAIQRLKDRTLPDKAACITFDDGYADNAENALPILQKYNVPATFFIAAGFLDGKMMWNDKVIELVRRTPGDHLDLSALDLGKHPVATLEQRRRTLFALIEKFKYQSFEERHAMITRLVESKPIALPDNLMMRTEQVRQLHQAGMEIGGHTLSHPILARTDSDTAYAEIADGKAKLEAIIQSPIRFFAYPNGKPWQDYRPEHVNMLKTIGFEAAFATAWGAADYQSDVHQLPRFTPWDRSRSRFILRMVQNMFRPAEIASDQTS